MSAISRVELLLMQRPWLSYVSLVGFYALLHLPRMFEASSFTGLIFPLESFYLARLLFNGFAINPDIAATVASPANAALIYPPGFFGFAALAGTVSGMFWILFVLQLTVGPLLYRLAVKALPRAGALLLALLATYYCTRSDWWAPDFMIQPFMLCGILLLLGRRLRSGDVFQLILLGQIAGLVISLKHNIGVFFAILCGTWLFLNAFRPARKSLPRQGMIAAAFLLVGFFAFIPIFGRRLIYANEWFFYLLPYVFFWIGFVLFLKNESLAFDFSRFIRNSAIFSISALALPGLIFVAFGSVIGYGRYWHSLFGMGFEYLPIWDHGILGIIKQYFVIRGAAETYNSFVFAGLFVFPLAVNLWAAKVLVWNTAVAQWSVRRSLAAFRIAGLGVMGVFMLFPLEGYHILSTKLFFFAFVAAWFLRQTSPWVLRPLGYLLALMLLPVLGLGAYQVVAAQRLETLSGSPVMQQMIGLPLQKEIAEELARQLDVVHRNVRGAPYYVIDSSGGTLIGLATLEDNRLPQYYIEMRPGILSTEVVEAIKADLATRPFVIVNADDYANRDQTRFDPFLQDVLRYVDSEYIRVDAYLGPQPRAKSIDQIKDFIVLQRRKPT